MSVKTYWLGDKDFYSRLFKIVLPIVVQNFITNFVGVLDNIMVGQMGTDQMNGVSVVNQLVFVYNLCVWGSVCGAGLFTTQFFGKGDEKGVQDTFRAKVVLSVAMTILFIAAFLWKGDFLIRQFLHEKDGIGNAEATLSYGIDYLHIILIGLIPMAFNFSYSNTLRDMGETSLPMKAGIAAVFVNLVLNYILIFGHFGFPSMGALGAAVATVVSRFVEVSITAFYAHFHPKKYPFVVGAYKSLKIPFKLMKAIIITGIPLALNETLWALGLTLMNQCYSLRGLTVIAALNINSTILNLFNVVLFAVGEAISIVAGQLLGAGKIEEAKTNVRKMILFSVSVCIVIGFVLSLLRGVFPMIYKTEIEVKNLASRFILVSSIFMPVMALVHGCYFTLRTGGKTIITFLFDSFFVCVLTYPLAFFLTHFTTLDIFYIYIAVSSMDILKATIGVVLVKKGVWIKRLV